MRSCSKSSKPGLARPYPRPAPDLPRTCPDLPPHFRSPNILYMHTHTHPHTLTLTRTLTHTPTRGSLPLLSPPAACPPWPPPSDPLMARGGLPQPAGDLPPHRPGRVGHVIAQRLVPPRVAPFPLHGPPRASRRRRRRRDACCGSLCLTDPAGSNFPSHQNTCVMSRAGDRWCPALTPWSAAFAHTLTQTPFPSLPLHLSVLPSPLRRARSLSRSRYLSGYENGAFRPAAGSGSTRDGGGLRTPGDARFDNTLEKVKRALAKMKADVS